MTGNQQKSQRSNEHGARKIEIRTGAGAQGTPQSAAETPSQQTGQGQPGGEPAPAESRAESQAQAGEDLAALRREVADANDRALRAAAELENYRKRSRRELDEERRFAALPIVRDMLLVLDNLERAVEAAGKSGGDAGLLDGVKMVAQQFNGVLAQHHCQRIEAVGQPFDPNLHEAVGQEPSDVHPAGTVVRELRPGYLLHDRVVRPTQVLVSVAPPGGPPASS